MRKCLGIEIGHSHIKAAYMERGHLRQYISEQIAPDSMNDQDICADFLREILREHGIHCKNAVFVLRYDDTYVKRLCLPLMTIRELKLNLPYEFYDYIGDEMEDYQFDYAVLGRSETDMDILAAACRKELSENIRILAKNAGLRLIGLVPEVLGFGRIFQRAGKRDYVAADFGSMSIRVHFFKNAIYDITRTIEYDSSVFADAAGKKDSESVRKYGRNVAMQIQRALNFYCYINGDNSIDGLYCCGGGIKFRPFLEELEQVLDIPVRIMGTFFELSRVHEPEQMDSPQSFGVLLTGRKPHV